MLSSIGRSNNKDKPTRSDVVVGHVDRAGAAYALIRRLIVAAALAQGLAGQASALPLLFEKVTSGYITSPYSVTTANFFFSDSYSSGATQSGGYTLNASMQTFGIDVTVTPADWVLDLLGVDSVLGIGKTGATTVSYSTSLRLVGDAGASALVSGRTSVGGYYNHQIDSLPSGDARSSVTGLVQIFGSGPSVQTSRNHDRDIFHADTSIMSLAGDQASIAPFELLVGDIVNVSGYFTVSSFAEINDACLFGVCVPGAGPLALSQTIGDFSVRLDLQEIRQVPEPPAIVLIIVGLPGIVLLRRVAPA